MNKVFVKKVKYVENKERIVRFGLRNRWGKVWLIIMFILLSPMIAVVCWILEFIQFINTKRVETYVEQKTKSRKSA